MEISKDQLILKRLTDVLIFKKNILLAEVGKTGYNLSQGTAIAALSEIPTGSDVTNLGPVSVFRYCMFFAV